MGKKFSAKSFMLCKVLFASARHNLLKMPKGYSYQSTGCIKQSLLVEKSIIYVKNLKILQNFYHFLLSKLLENSCYFDVPKFCNLAFVLDIMINSIKSE